MWRHKHSVSLSMIPLRFAPAIPCLAAILSCPFASVADSPPVYLSHPPQRAMPARVARPEVKGPALFVDPLRGYDANDGTEDRPWRTIQHALPLLNPGDTLVLRGGSYFENVYCAVAGTPEKPITIRSFPGEIAVIDGGIPDF